MGMGMVLVVFRDFVARSLLLSTATRTRFVYDA